MDITKEEKIESLYRSPLRLVYNNGEGKVIDGPPYRGEEDYLLDYYILLGKVPLHVIYKYLTKTKIGGILVAEADHRDFGEINDMVTFLNKVANQHAYSYLVDGVRYVFVTRLEM